MNKKLLLLRYLIACLLLYPFVASAVQGISLFGRQLVVAPGVPPAFSAEDLNYLIPKKSDGFLLKGERQIIRSLREQALNNQQDGQARLGDRYFDGNLVEQNISYALAWYQVAAYNGSPYAQYTLSVLYREGVILPSNIRVSAAFESVANTHGDARDAQRRLGIRSLDFTSPFYNSERAQRWLKRAARAGDLPAQLRLGDLYSDSSEISPDAIQALNWYGKAAANDSSQAQFEIATMYMRGEGVLPQSAETAFEWMSKSAFSGYSFAQIHLGLMYADGVGVTENNVLAYAWLKLSEDHLQQSADLNTPFLDRLLEVSRSLDYEQQLQATQLHQELRVKFYPET